MKIYKILPIVLLSIFSRITAQNTFPATGNVGIGTTSPSEKLTVSGNVLINGALYSNSQITNGFNTNGSSTYNQFRNNGTNIGIIGSLGSMIGSDPLDFGMWVYGSNNYRLYTNGGERLRVTGNGNVGIGTNNPQYKLDITGDFRSVGGIFSTFPSNEGGYISIQNSTKTGTIANDWRIYNMTGGYGNALTFWSYNQNGGSSGRTLCIYDNGNIQINRGSLDMASNKIINIADPTSARDAVPLSYYQNASNITTGTISTDRLASNIARKDINNMFSVYQTYTAGLSSSVASNEGGFISLYNGNKTGEIANDWRIYNMTGGYGNALTFWSYNQNGGSSGRTLCIYDNGNIQINRGSLDMASNKIINIADPTSARDAVPLSYYQNASNITTGTISTDRLASNIARKDINNMFSVYQTYTAGLSSNIASNEGGFISLYNSSKIGATANDWRIYNMTGVYGNALTFWSYNQNGGSSGRTLSIYDNGNIITDRGNMGIGTYSPKAKLDVNGNVAIGMPTDKAYPDTYKLAIGGNALAEKMVVKLQTNWPDYVFHSDYALPPLSQVEEHIKAKGHLPNIPTEKEVKETGIDLGDMNAKLLQKIEELTLYLIENDKKFQLLQEESKKEIQLLKEEIKKLKSK